MGSTNQETVHFDGSVEKETERAFLIDIGTDKIWIPKSQVRSRTKGKGEDTWEIPNWLAKEKGLI